MVQTFFTVAFAFFSLPFTLAHPAALTEPVDPRFGCFAEPPAEFLNEVAKVSFQTLPSRTPEDRGLHKS